ncbi:unnamed protein product [Soboliphyme baturini]|uniref:Uncharacterized protein n=1 Tax=Soboliphyme baturini TaxID=241478 RepID=A0A183J8S3_9BILA|nr:unnamed protein product [Soboliphyme baturini]
MFEPDLRENEFFLEEAKSALHEVRITEFTILMRGFNVHAEAAIEKSKCVIGKNDSGDLNNKGLKLVVFSANNGLLS